MCPGIKLSRRIIAYGKRVDSGAEDSLQRWLISLPAALSARVTAARLARRTWLVQSSRVRSTAVHEADCRAYCGERSQLSSTSDAC